ncbi:hypothetical protein [Marinobacterium aestuariivivens]|uniref:MFS transporter n=1 Tax=Marinobacterium aestuariivivens TaxID=1698799 RepID=A0ABW2AA16_9GAMM
MTKTAETVRSGQIDNSKLMQAGFAQCVFILLQSVAFLNWELLAPLWLPNAL